MKPMLFRSFKSLPFKCHTFLQAANANPLLRSANRQHSLIPRVISRGAHSVNEKGVEFDQHKFSWLFLRDACSCPQCVDPSTRQKVFEFSDIPTNIQHGNVRRISKNDIEITWKNDIPGYKDHKTVLPIDFLRENASMDSRMKASNNILEATSWKRDSYSEQREEFEYDSYMNSQETLQNAVRQLARYGLAFIHNSPIDLLTARKIAERIGPLRNTFYGEMWDVRSRPAAKNVAYTSDNLGFHQDLMYMTNPPGIQLLHVMKSSTDGGESLFSDCVNAVEQIQAKEPELVRVLRDFPVTYHYHNDGQWYQYTRPTLEGGMLQMMRGMADKVPPAELKYPRDYEFVNYSPQFQGTFQISSHDSHEEDDMAEVVQMKKYQQAVKMLKIEMEKPEHIYETKMKEGTCVIFNNRRVVHARRAFTSIGGERWLRGCYVDTDCLMNQWRKFNEASAEPHVSDAARKSSGPWVRTPGDVEKVFGDYVEGRA